MLSGGVASAALVVGHRGDEVRRAARLDGRAIPVAVLEAADHARGLSASLAAGIASVPAAADAVLVALGDMPFVRPDTIGALTDAFERAPGRDAILRPVVAGRPGHPVLFGRAHLAALGAATGDRGARALLAERAEAVIAVPTEDSGVLADLDTEADFLSWGGSWRPAPAA